MFLPLSFGDFVGGLLAGRLADWTLVHHSKKRTQASIASNALFTGRTTDTAAVSELGTPSVIGKAEPMLITKAEDRLRMLWVGGLLLAPTSLLATGWLMQTE